MKYFTGFVFVILFLSCSPDEIHLNLDKNVQVYLENEKYYGNNIIKFEIKLNNVNGDINYNYYEAGVINNGILTLFYNDIDEIACEDIINVLYLSKNIKISNEEAKIFVLMEHNILVYNNENEKIGFLNFGDLVCCGGIGLNYIYSTQETEIQGANYDFIYKLKLNKGWNQVYNFRRGFTGQMLNTTNGNKFPRNEKWRLIVE